MEQAQTADFTDCKEKQSFYILIVPTRDLVHVDRLLFIKCCYFTLTQAIAFRLLCIAVLQKQLIQAIAGSFLTLLGRAKGEPTTGTEKFFFCKQVAKTLDLASKALLSQVSSNGFGIIELIEDGDASQGALGLTLKMSTTSIVTTIIILQGYATIFAMSSDRFQEKSIGIGNLIRGATLTKAFVIIASGTGPILVFEASEAVTVVELLLDFMG
uniref:Uncharacterized protein n=1 Tax=Romanomermis culicivorax TaxID=13658 RepID=A0A915IE65_ROMCU